MATPKKPGTTWSDDTADGVGDVPSDVAVSEGAEGRYAATGEVLGQGGLGRVDAVRDRDLGREVARKQMLSDDRGQRERFLREARITAQIEHPGVVPVYELGQDAAGRPYYTMRRIRGQTLGSALGSCKNLQQRLGLLPAFIAACHAVAYAHSKGVVHRDLKPDNVMVGQFGETLVVDWGLAKAGDDEAIDIAPSGMYQAALPKGAALTRMGATMGTPAYMSPEQARGESHKVDARSDVWALGAMLFELLAGKALFEEADGDTIIGQLKRGGAEGVAARLAEAPSDLVAVVGKALANDSKDRYPDAGAFAADLVAWQAGGLVDAYRYSLRELVLKNVRRYRGALAVGVAAVGVLGVILAVSYASVRAERDRAVEAEAVAERRSAEARTRLAGSLAGAADVALRAGDPLSAYVLALGSLELEESPGARGVLMASASDPLPELIGQERLSDGCALPEVSDQGRLACLTDEGVRVWRAFPGPSTVLPLVHNTGRESWALDWSPDGKHVAAVRFDGTLWTWDVDQGGEPASYDVDGLVFATFLDNDTLLLSNETTGIGRVDLGQRAPTWSSVHATVRFDTLVPTARGVVAGSVVDPIGLWDVEHDTFEEITPHTVAPLVAASADGRSVLSASGWGSAVAPVSLLAEGAVTALGPPRAVAAVGLSDDGLRAVTATEHGVDVWDGPEWRRVTRVPADASVLGLVLSPDGRELFMAEDDGDVRRFRLPRPGGDRPLDGGGTVWDLRLTEDGRQMVSGGNDGWLRVWDLASGNCVKRWLVDPAGLGSIAIVGRDAIVATNARGMVRVNLDDGAERWSVPFDGTVNGVERLGTDALILTDASGDVARMNLDGTIDWRVYIAKWAVSGFESVDHRILVSADLQVIWLDPKDGHELARTPTTTVIGPSYPLPNGDYAAAGRGEVLRYDAQGKGPIGRWAGQHDGSIRTFAWRDDLAVTGADDGRVCVWDADGAARACWRAHTSTIWRVEASRALPFVASGGADGAVHRYSLDLLDADTRPLLEEARVKYGLAAGDGVITEILAP